MFEVSALFKSMSDDEVYEEVVVLCFYLDLEEGMNRYAVYGADDYGLPTSFVRMMDRDELDEHIKALLAAVDPIYGEHIPFND